MKNVWLAHHGILGQRWGIRRFQKKDGSYTSAGKKRYGKDGRSKVAESDTAEKQKFWTDERKTLAKKIAIGTAVVAGVALASYGTYKLYQDGKLNPIIDKFKKRGENSVKVKELTSNDGAGSGVNIADLFNKRVGNPDITTDFKGINPSKNQPLTDVNFVMRASDGALMDEVNCQACSLAYEIKRRTGMDVAAQQIDTRKFPENTFLERVYKNPITLKQSVSDFSELEDLSKFGEGARGCLCIKRGSGKHQLQFEVVNGKVAIFDAQSERVFTPNSGVLDIVYNATKDVEITRTDNLEFNEIDLIMSAVYGKKQ